MLKTHFLGYSEKLLKDLFSLVTKFTDFSLLPLVNLLNIPDLLQKGLPY